MKILLDTHTFMWLEKDVALLSAYGRTIVSHPDTDLFLSHVSIWEIQIKLSIGKLNAKLPLNERVTMAQSLNGLQLLPIKLEHIYVLNDLPLHHRDPFDRLLIAQAVSAGLPLLSKDRKLQAYPVQVIW